MPTSAEIQALALTRLRQAITASGLSAVLYAKQVLIRDPRTCRRWLSGESPIPQSVIEFLAKDYPL